MLPLTELLAGLAEEACELGQAALKLRRVFDGTNPTPTTEQEAIDHLEEEIADVTLYLDQIKYSRKQVGVYKGAKLRRWKERLYDRVKDRADADERDQEAGRMGH